MSIFKRLFGRSDKDPPTSDGDLRAVPGAGAYNFGGKVIYNALDPVMQQFMGRCIGAVKKSGIRAGGTGQFSISLHDGAQELLLDEFWARVCDDPASQSTVIEDVVASAQRLVADS